VQTIVSWIAEHRNVAPTAELVTEGVGT
jgi:hypothetical protein